MKKSEKQNLLKRIINHCKKYEIKGSFNNRCGEYLVSFEIKTNKEQKGGEK